jgi:cbb3-type cytochrome oxidase maturation protein
VESFYFLIPIALIFVAVALRFLFWAINSGQYDNLDTEAHRILFDEDEPANKPSEAAPPSESAQQESESGRD